MVDCPVCGSNFYAETNDARAVAPEEQEVSREPFPSKGVVGYLGAHWRGELSLAVSYWVNGVLFTVGSYVIIKFAGSSLEHLYDSLPVKISLGIALGYILLFGIISAWQWVGIWRAASSSRRRMGKMFWPGMAKLMVVIGILAAVPNAILMTSDIVRTFGTLSDPVLADYEVTILDETDLIFYGAINDQSVDRTISALSDSQIEILRIQSQGGLTSPAIRLARYVEDAEVFVMAEGECASACVLVLAASPSAAIYPGTIVSFHYPEGVVEMRSRDLRASVDDMRVDVEQQFRKTGIKEWALTETRRLGYWSPSMTQQIEMGLLKFVYDPDAGQFVTAGSYCLGHTSECE